MALTLPSAFDLSGRVAVVTGAGSENGIGFASARLLGELGARVVVAATTERACTRADELRSSGIEASGFVGDLTAESVAGDLIHHARDTFGAPDVLVNNAGMVSVSDPDVAGGGVGELSVQRWHASLRRNLDTAFLVSRAALPGMTEAGWGRVVMVTSVTGPVMAMRSDVAYASAKAALVGLARALAVDSAAAGVTVNAVAPGWIGTGSQTEQERLDGLVTPVGRSGTPEEIAAAIAWLATPAASYVTGQCLVVDGGNSIAEQRATS